MTGHARFQSHCFLKEPSVAGASLIDPECDKRTKVLRSAGGHLKDTPCRDRVANKIPNYYCHVSPLRMPSSPDRLSSQSVMPVFQVGSAKVMSRVGNQGRSWTAARTACTIMLAFGAITLLTSCNYVTVGNGGTVALADVDVLDKVRS